MEQHSAVTVLFDNGAKTFCSKGSQDHEFDSLILNLEKITNEGFNTSNGYDLVNLNKVKSIARSLYRRQDH